MIPIITTKRCGEFSTALLKWFAAHMRPLPWRTTYAPYSIWISEIMLQQTQMERGVKYFNNWMKRFPDISSVAQADEEAILGAWEGLGYYSRARNLHAAAKYILREHDGMFPDTPEAIRALPGVGEYTAAAIAAIAFNLPEPAVDANVLRVFARLGDIAAPVTDKNVKDFITETVRALIPPDSSRLFCQGLMEFGALVCSKKPRCADCLFAGFCAALHHSTVADRPVKKGKNGYTLIETTAGVVFRENRVYIRKRPAGGLWAGMWEFPGGNVDSGESPEEAAHRHIRRETGLNIAIRKKIATVRHGYTTNRVTLHGFLCDVETEARLSKQDPTWEHHWALPGELANYAFPAGHRKLLERLGWKTAKSSPA